jgi:hypothetical protein
MAKRCSFQKKKPGAIGAVTDLREIMAAIDRGDLQFIELSAQEIQQLRSRGQESGDLVESTSINRRKRKERSDKGKCRGSRKKKGDENEGVIADVMEEESRKRKQMGALGSRKRPRGMSTSGSGSE